MPWTTSLTSRARFCHYPHPLLFLKWPSEVFYDVELPLLHPLLALIMSLHSSRSSPLPSVYRERVFIENERRRDMVAEQRREAEWKGLEGRLAALKSPPCSYRARRLRIPHAHTPGWRISGRC